MEIKSFALDGRFGDPLHFSVAKNIKDSLEKGGLAFSQEEPGLVVCIGGDGSLLKSLKARGYEGSYLLINGGTLGFLGDYRTNEWEKAVWDILNNQAPAVEDYAPLVCVDRYGHHFYAGNDVSLIAPVRAVNFDVFVNNERLSTVQGSGIVVASALGSTAFNLSLGGPVVLSCDGSYAFSLVAPIANRITHTFAQHVVLGPKDVLKIRLEQNARLYKIGGDGIEDHSVEGHEFLFYSSTRKRFFLVRYRNRSRVRRIADAFSTKS